MSKVVFKWSSKVVFKWSSRLLICRRHALPAGGRALFNSLPRRRQPSSWTESENLFEPSGAKLRHAMMVVVNIQSQDSCQPRTRESGLGSLAKAYTVTASSRNSKKSSEDSGVWSLEPGLESHKFCRSDPAIMVATPPVGKSYALPRWHVKGTEGMIRLADDWTEPARTYLINVEQTTGGKTLQPLPGKGSPETVISWTRGKVCASWRQFRALDISCTRSR
jgi:hypothetical protein